LKNVKNLLAIGFMDTSTVILYAHHIFVVIFSAGAKYFPLTAWFQVFYGVIY